MSQPAKPHPLILLTNDDGIFSPGLQAAAEAVADLGELLIVAPSTQQTGMSRSLPAGENLGIIKTEQLSINGQQQLAYSVHGSPSLAVVHAVLEIAPHLPDLCISGINYGENVGMTTLVSGTVGAALEAHTNHIPAIAVSTEADLALHHAQAYGTLDWTIPKYFVRHFAEKVLAIGLPPEVAVLNVNVPAGASTETQIRFTVQSQQSYYYFIKGNPRDFSQPYRPQVTNIVDRDQLEPNSDIQALVYDRVVSVTPLAATLSANVNLGAWFLP